MQRYGNAIFADRMNRELLAVWCKGNWCRPAMDGNRPELVPVSPAENRRFAQVERCAADGAHAKIALLDRLNLFRSIDRVRT